MRLSRSIYVVASGINGFALSNSFDCNVYLVDCGSSLVLIDCGAGLEPERILKNIINLGFDSNKITDIFITHAHADHCGGASFFKNKTGANVHAYNNVAKAISTADVGVMSLDIAINAGIYPLDYSISPCDVEYINIDNPISIGNITFKTILTSGHSIDHCSFYATIDAINVFFAGDSFFPSCAISLQPIWDCNIMDYAKSAQRVSTLKIDALLPSHHKILMSGGQQVITDINFSFESLEIPPQA